MNTKTIRLTDKQLDFLDSSYNWPVTFYGGARGGGKSHGLRALIYVRAMEQPLNIAIFRKTYPELRANHIEKFLFEYPDLKQYYNKTDKTFKLPSGSTIELCHCQRYEDVLLYQGREWDILAIDEAGQFEERIFQTLRGSVRTSKVGVKPCVLLTGNPGGIGHKWLKRIFVDKRFNENERPEDYNFISSKVYDCAPLIDADPDYISRLEAEPNEALRKAYLHGDWDIFAGQFFSEWNRDIHVVPANYKIENHWIRWGAYDHGYNHPASFGWYAVDEDGVVIKYRELVVRHHRPDEIGKIINSYTDTKKLQYCVAGHDIWATRDGGPTIAEKFSSLPDPIYFSKANIDRIQGASQMRDYLAYENLQSGNKGPLFKVTANCTRTIDCIPAMIHDERRPEDVKKVDATDSNPFGGDDTYDESRYSLMSRPGVSKPKLDVNVDPASAKVHRWQEERRKKFSRQNNKNYDNVLGNNW